MPSASDAAEIQAILTDLSTLAARDMAAVWARISPLPPGEVRDYLVAALPDLIDPYATAAGAFTTQWYDDQDPSSRFRARPAGLPDPAALEASTRWALSPLFGVGTGDPLTMLAGAAQRSILNVSRQTVIENTDREAGATWARHASANACSFCALMASRGAVYASKASATRVVGRGRDVSTNFREDGSRKAGGQAKGVKARGKQKSGDKYHDHCHCIAVPVRPGLSYEPPSYVQGWEDAYVKAARETKGTGQYGAIDTKAVLSHMRGELGTH